MVGLEGTALMGSHLVMNHRSSNLCIVSCGDEDTPVKLMFLAVPSPTTENHNDNSCLLPEGWDAKHATSIACSQEADSTCDDAGTPPGSTSCDDAGTPPDSTSCDDAGTPPAVAEERDVRKPSRPCKEKRNRYKKLVKRLEVQILQDPSSFDFETISLPPSLQRNDRQRVKLMERMNSFHYRAKIHDEFEVNMVTL